jgi:hypothetical protein
MDSLRFVNSGTIGGIFVAGNFAFHALVKVGLIFEIGLIGGDRSYHRG